MTVKEDVISSCPSVQGPEKRPMIQAGVDDKARVLKLIDRYEWAADCIDRLKQGMEPPIEAHRASEAYAAESVPPFPARIHSHINAVKRAMHAGQLYFLTGNEDYARYAADVLNVYVQVFGGEGVKPVASNEGPGRDYRDVHNNLALAYDFIHAFLTRPDMTVYDKGSQSRISFDLDRTQLMFRNILELGFEYWIEGSNHTEMEGFSLLYCSLAIEDDAQRDAYIETFIEGSKPMTGLKWMKQLLVENDGVWPESSSYCRANRGVLRLMETVNRIYPEKEIFKDFERGLNGVTERRFYFYPNGSEMVSFGDAHRAKGYAPIPDIYIPVIRAVGCEDVAERIFGHMKAEREMYGYKPNDLWAMDPLEDYVAKRIESQAVVLPYAGLVIQSNLHCADEKEHGMMYYTGGAEYVHSHCSGLDFEFYGAGYVMGGVGGMHSPRSTAIFNDYYRNYAGHNTVVVNETSRGGSIGFWGNQKMLYMDTTRMEALEPRPYTPAVSTDFTFSSQRLDDTINNATQQRIVGIIRTSDTSGYYLDMFRSRSNKEDVCHDYVYHNMGDRLALQQDDGTDLHLEEAAERYKSYPVTRYRVNPEEETTIHRYVSPTDKQGDYKESLTLNVPGWHHFSDVMSSGLNAKSIRGTFFMDALERYTHVAMPGGFEREYSYAKAPAIPEAAAPYASAGHIDREDRTKAQVLTVRQPGEAWGRPFIVIFEPSDSRDATIRRVDTIIDGEKVIGATVVSNVGGRTITDRIIAQDRAYAMYRDAETGLTFTGRYAVARTIDSPAGRELHLYIGDGKKLSFLGHELEAGGNCSGYMITPMGHRKR